MVNSKIKYIQSLSHKKLRDQEGVFVAEGPKIINELLSAPGMELQELYALKNWIDSGPHPGAAVAVQIDEATLERISTLSTPNQVLAIFRQPFQNLPYPDLTGKITLMADSIQDPGNIGSILRCADWFGISVIFCSRSCADVFGPKSVQSTMGSIARVRVIYDDLKEVISRYEGLSVYAATLSGTDVRMIQRPREGFVLIGNESRGVDPEILRMSQHQVRIAGKGGADSLNAAVATGIILSHLIQ